MHHPLKTLPSKVGQHVTAGPHSTVLEIDARRLIVISETLMPAPPPVRTALQAVLLPGVLAGIETWAVKKSRD